MHIYRQMHVYAHIYLPEGGMNGDETAQMLLTKYKQSEKEVLGFAGTGGICNCSSVRWCAGLIFELLDCFDNFKAVASEKMYEKIILQSWKMKSEDGEGTDWGGQQSENRILDCLGWKNPLSHDPSTSSPALTPHPHIFYPPKDGDSPAALDSVSNAWHCFQCRNFP